MPEERNFNQFLTVKSWKLLRHLKKSILSFNNSLYRRFNRYKAFFTLRKWGTLSDASERNINQFYTVKSWKLLRYDKVIYLIYLI